VPKSIVVAEWDANTQGSLAIRVSGADVRAVQPGIPYDAKRGAIPVSGTSVITLTLGNLSASQIVQIRTLSGKDPVGQPILLAVQPAAHPE
jgi:pantoate kinase